MDRRELVETLAYAGLTPADMSRIDHLGVQNGRSFLPGPRTKGVQYGDARAILASAQAAGRRDEGIVGLAMFCGLRQIELRRLDTSDLSESTTGLYVRVVGKGKRVRRVRVPAQMAPTIRALAASSTGPLFKSGQNGYGSLSKRGMNMVINRHLTAAGADITPHGLRHSFVTWLLNTGATLEEAMEIVGHTTVSSHEIYAAAGEAWFWDHWRRVHPISARGEGDGYIYVPGEKFAGRMASGVERIVPVPNSLVQEIRSSVCEHADFLGNPRRISHNMNLRGRRAPMAIREDAAIQMAEGGAHPFFLSLILGITADSVIAAKFDRRGPLAEAARVAAMERAVAPLMTPATLKVEVA